jgi:hypothetical protein
MALILSMNRSSAGGIRMAEASYKCTGAMSMKKTATPPEQETRLTPEKRKEMESAYARRDLEFLRQQLASNNLAVSELAERFMEQLLEQIRSERDRSDAFSLKKKISATGEPEADSAEANSENEV